METNNKTIIQQIKDTVSNYQDAPLKGPMGYKFYTYKMLSVLFLYINSVDVKNPDITGKTNKNTFIYEAQDEISKIKEQVRLALKDLGFLLRGSSDLAKFVMKGANRKMLKDNNFEMQMRYCADNGVDFGSGFLKAWRNAKGKIKSKSVDPYKIYFDPYDFAGGWKVEPLRRKLADIKNDKTYDPLEIARLIENQGDKKDTDVIVLYQGAKPIEWDEDGLALRYQVCVVDTEGEYVFYKSETKNETDLQYFKWDYEKRQGYKDALGRGANEKIFNVIVRTKVGQERLEKVMKVATVLALQKQIDGPRDVNIGKQVGKLETGTVIGHKGNKLEPVDLGGDKQIAFITSEMQSLAQKAGTLLNMNDSLQGNTLPSGTSGSLGNLLTENASSVFKDGPQKNFANMVERAYDKVFIPNMLKMFNKDEDLEQYLDTNDLVTVKKYLLNYRVLRKQIEAEVRNEDFNYSEAKEEAKQEMKGKEMVPGELLAQLKEEAKSIEVIITGEKTSKAATVAFLREMRNTYAQNPELFRDAAFIEMLKKEADYEQGIDALDIEQILEQMAETQEQA